MIILLFARTYLKLGCKDKKPITEPFLADNIIDKKVAGYLFKYPAGLNFTSNLPFVRVFAILVYKKSPKNGALHKSIMKRS